jgi:glycosyltransferase involved in cell wall biosynthesis
MSQTTISVVIPVCNGSRTIQATLESVLRQTVPADEILVMDDGSTDNTLSLLQAYEPRITVFRQPNKGAAAARNALCAQVKGDLIAFMDSDDLWHPRYLEQQRASFRKYPSAVAFFAGCNDLYGYGNYEWADLNRTPEKIEVLDTLSFFKRLDTSSGIFFPSLTCVPKKVLAEFNGEPFCRQVSDVADSYLFRRLALLGDVVIDPTVLVAYRYTKEAISEDMLKMCRLGIECYEALEDHYWRQPDELLYKTFRLSLASQRRQYAKRLMGAGMDREARRQIRLSFFDAKHYVSMGKSFGFLLLSYFPTSLQPKWPSPRRVWRRPAGAAI